MRSRLIEGRMDVSIATAPAVPLTGTCLAGDRPGSFFGGWGALQ